MGIDNGTIPICQWEASRSLSHYSFGIIPTMARTAELDPRTLDPYRRRVWNCLCVAHPWDMKAASLKAGKKDTYMRDFFRRGHPDELPEVVRERLAQATGKPADFFRKEWKPDQGLTGRGLKERKRLVVETTAEDISSRNPDTVRIEEIDMRAGLGGGGLVEAVNVTEGGRTMSKDLIKANWDFPKNYLTEKPIPTNGLYLFRAVGDSMTKPDGGGIHSGDILLADTTDKHPVPPGIFAFDNGFGVVVKRLEFVSYSDPPMLNIISDNPDHPIEKLPAEQVRVIGRCVWYGRWI